MHFYIKTYIPSHRPDVSVGRTVPTMIQMCMVSQRRVAVLIRNVQIPDALGVEPSSDLLSKKMMGMCCNRLDISSRYGINKVWYHQGAVLSKVWYHHGTVS